MRDEKPAPSMDELRDALAAKLNELHRRATHAKQLLTPETYWKNPWIRFGLGAAVGFVVGLSGHRRGEPGLQVAHEPLGRSLVRVGLSAALTSVITRALTPRSLPPGTDV